MNDDTSKGTATPAGSFDPSKYLVNLNGRGEYLEVKWRLLWLRTRHPDVSIETEMVKLGEREAVFKATITIPSGGSATGWGSESAGDFRDFIEKAETKAIGRACAALGYGTQFCNDHEHGDTGNSSRVAAAQAPPPAKAQTSPAQAAAKSAAPAPAPGKVKPQPSPEEVAARMQDQVRNREESHGKRVAAAQWLFRDAPTMERIMALWEDTKDNDLTDERVNAAYQQAILRFAPSMAG